MVDPHKTHTASRSRLEESAPQRQRLQKVLAAAGLGSRRKCEELMIEGRVEVDRRVVTELGTKVDPDQQEVRVDGVALPRTKRVYHLVNKPPGVVSTNRDPAGRPRVIDLLPPRGQRLFAVGRLDMSSEGLILVTNDGELANLLTHPKYGVEKTYQVEVAGTLERDQLAELSKGAHLAEGFARVVSARVKGKLKNSTLLEIVLAEGRNREIRRLLARAGHKVLRLKRIALGPLRLGELPPGAFRPLDREEVRQLRQAAGAAHPPKKSRRAAQSFRPKAARAVAASGGQPGRPRRPARPGQPQQTKRRQPTIIGDAPSGAGVRDRPARSKTGTKARRGPRS